MSSWDIKRTSDAALPGEETEVDLPSSTMVLLSVEGVAWMVIRRRPGTRLASCLKAVNCLGWLDRRWKPRWAS
jgi:hypothetical protein